MKNHGKAVKVSALLILVVGVALSGILLATDLLDSSDTQLQFVSSDNWAECVAADACPPTRSLSDSAPVEVPGFEDAQAYLSWRQTVSDTPVRMLSADDLNNPNLPTLAAAAADRSAGYPVQIWMDECRPAESFTNPSPSRREIYNMPPEGPERMNPSGQVCVGADCIECQVGAISSTGEVRTRWLYHVGPYRGIGMITVESEGDAR